MLFGKKKETVENNAKSDASTKSAFKVPSELEYLAAVTDKKMHFKAGRTKRVADTALEMLNRMHKDDELKEKIYRLAYVYDAGMMYVPDEILGKKGPLTDDELAVLRERVISAEECANILKEYPDAGKIIRAHYERYDGKGYPDGLEEKEIPFETRVLQVACAYVSMTSVRPYHEIFTKGMARGEIIANKVSQFDPVAADALIDMIDEDIDYKLKEED